ncbi:MAG: HAD family phosphatase, partial [Acidobacteriota bacterium]|nr:HAD family phosphatase [Acidobacteriota bacterium]
MSRLLDNLADQRLAVRHGAFSRDYVNALGFLVEHTTRYCGAWVDQPGIAGPKSPVVFLDIDGVIDKQIFGFPSNTAAGMEALSLLNRHSYTTVINSARSVDEARVYAEAYGCAGAISEYGCHVWDRNSGRTECLADSDSLAEMEKVRRALLEVPGVFLDERYRYIIRAFLYARETTVPVPKPVIEGVMARVGSQRLRLHQTFTDSTVTPAGTDKGLGLQTYLQLAGLPNADTVAVGDSEPDLAMFRVAGKSFAPSHISCRAAAKLLGTRVAGSSYQKGFLECVKKLIHPDGSVCPACGSPRAEQGSDLFLSLLRDCDVSPYRWLIRSLFDYRSLAAFRR